MPTLEWIGKSKVINHHQEVPYRVLDKKYTFNADESENRIIHGDNLLALKSLLPQYEGGIDCIYIDPPYNTGAKEGQWVYSDNVDDYRIKKWLGDVVGAEGEDLSRHDKWLCMMYPRLKLLHKLLSNNGIIFISIDENEVYNLKMIMDEIFGSSNFIANLIVTTAPAGTQSSTDFAMQHAYCLVYSKSNKHIINKLKLTSEELDKKYSLKDNLGDYYIERLWKRGIGGKMEDVPSLHFPVYFNPKTHEILINNEINEINDINNFVKILPYQNSNRFKQGCAPHIYKPFKQRLF